MRRKRERGEERAKRPKAKAKAKEGESIPTTSELSRDIHANIFPISKLQHLVILIVSFAAMDISKLPSTSVSPRSPRSPIEYKSPIRLEYVDIKLRQHQQHLPDNINPPSNSTTPEPLNVGDTLTPIISSFAEKKYKRNLQTLSDCWLTHEQIDVARRWGQDATESLRESRHIELLVECVKSIFPPWDRVWDQQYFEELHNEYNNRMEQWTHTIGNRGRYLEESQAKMALSKLVNAMDLAGYGNVELRWVTGVLDSDYPKQLFWAIREWCEARLEKVLDEIERKQQQGKPEMEIEVHGILEAQGNTQESKTEMETQKERRMEKIQKEKEIQEEKGIEKERETEMKTQNGVKTRKSQRNINSRKHKPQITDTHDLSQTPKIRNCKRNAKPGNHPPSHDNQERISQINDTPEPSQATNTGKYTRVTETSNPIQITNNRNHTQNITGHESTRKTENKKSKRNTKGQEQESYIQQSARITNIRKRTYADSNNMDSNTSNTKRLRRSPRLKSILDSKTAQNEFRD
ncbi:hypothetical protein DSL72_003969 [Monilinia vaccinii-corymbosi]|uniref:Uncharacterized protein n=1 Tax=Monilinia vaccinii-corymbosi TaxID=61207 RepID=A0A8A3NUT1_9HELO|nr:hypothetical protein DSL72_003969 [Monilinia vaccinii-corymbosi]